MILGVALALGGCEASSHAVTGTLRLSAPSVFRDYEYAPNAGSKLRECRGEGALADVASGAQVLVQDESGKTVGVGQLVLDPENSAAGLCAYTFRLDVGLANFYSFKVAGQNPVTRSSADLQSSNWVVALTISA